MCLAKFLVCKANMPFIVVVVVVVKIRLNRVPASSTVIIAFRHSKWIRQRLLGESRHYRYPV